MILKDLEKKLMWTVIKFKKRKCWIIEKRFKKK